MPAYYHQYKIQVLQDSVKSIVDDSKFYDIDELQERLYFLGKKHEKPQRFDIVVLTEREKKNGPEKTIVKRVIGLPGDRITVINGELFINNKHYREKYVVKKNKANYDKLNWTIKVPKNEIFVLGDNRDISKDSRIVGCFKKSAIKAVKAI